MDLRYSTESFFNHLSSIFYSSSAGIISSLKHAIRNAVKIHLERADINYADQYFRTPDCSKVLGGNCKRRGVKNKSIQEIFRVLSEAKYIRK